MEEIKDKITLVIVGRSGCGKGTQANLLVQKLAPFGVKHIETGHLLRESIKKENPTTAIVKNILKKGGFVPWWYPPYLWLKAFAEEGFTAYHLVFDGSPRKVKEAELLDEVIAWHGRPLTQGIHINVRHEESRQRLLLRKRSDDNPEAIANRLAAFEADTVPVIQYFREHDRLIEVNGEQSVEAVQTEVVNKLKEKLGDLWPRN
ncbi:MAG: nucleoside monophosphate kinase [bacterium]|nr:nucleoside monophosphate kinase [bacterium]